MRESLKNTSISWNHDINKFVNAQIENGRYKNVDEVVNAGLQLLQDEEAKLVALRLAIQKGVDSPTIEDFDFDEHLAKFKEQRKLNG
jgi:antitoxin ParD1/3/4